MGALQNSNYRLYFIGQLISMTGSWMQQVAMSWLVYRLTGSAALLGTIAFLGQVPVTLLSPYAGAIADRHDRRVILYATQIVPMLIAIAIGLLSLFNAIEIWQLITFSILLGITAAFDMPARQAFLSDMVSKNDLMNAIALNASVFHGARVVGPAIAGFLIAGIGESWCFLVNGISFLAVLVGLYLMKLNIEIQPHRGSAWESIREGLLYVWNHKETRYLMFLVAATSFFSMPYMVLMPILADQVLHGGAKGLGILMGLSGVGSVVGALLLAFRKPNPTKILSRIAFAAFGFGAFLIAFSFAESFWIAGLLVIPVGFCMVSQMATSNTRVQAGVPNQLRGRVMSVFGMMFMGVMPFGALAAGHVASYVGAPMTVRIGGIMTLLFGFLFYKNVVASTVRN
jgi:MFS family permease